MTELSRRDALIATAATGMLVLAEHAGAAPAAEAGPAGGAAAWNLGDLYPSPAAWSAARTAVAAQLPALAQWKGRLGESADTLRAALQAQSDVAIKVMRLLVYASLKGDEDLRVAANQERRQLATTLYAQFAEAIAWTGPEVLTVGRAKIERFLADDKGLAKFAFQLRDTLRLAPHTLGAEAEGVLAGTTAPLAGPADIRNQLVASDIPRPTITLADGSTIRLDDQGYTIARQSPVRADRKRVFDAFWASYQPFQSSLGTALSAQTTGEMFLARARRYGSALEASLASANLPEGVYRTLIAETNAGLPVLHRYFALRQRLLKLPDLAYYDIYPPLVSLDRTFTLEQMRALTIEAVKPLGPDYVALFTKATGDTWMDPLPRPGKAAGAYMNGSAYDVHPYLLLNLSSKYDGLTTYAHEWGHAMHTLLANAAQPFETAQYPTFIAEIASTLQESLLAEYMLAQARTPQEKLFYLGQRMETFRATFFRQAMFAEFQLRIHDLAEKGEGLSGEKMTGIYRDLLARYHGPKMIIDPLYAVEWASVPHFFYGFYVFQYSTSITAATYFANAVLTGGAAARDRYLSVLKAGGSDYGYDILKKAGLDMASPAPYRGLVKTFSDVLDQAEALVGKA